MIETRYAGLDGLRGLTALVVILHHTAVKGTDIGGLSVFMFFILSGFLITRILARLRLDVEAGKTSHRAALAQFWVQRALRIFPAYYVWLLIFLPFDVSVFGGQTLEHLSWYLFYVQNFLVAFVTFAWQNFTHTWSIAVEQQYYIFFAPLVLMIPGRRLSAFFISMIGVCLLGTTGLAVSGFEAISLYPSPTTGCVFLATGAMLAVAEPLHLANFTRKAIVWPALLMTTLLALYPLFERAHVLHVPYVLLVVASAASLGALLAALLAAPDRWPAQFLESAAPKFLGKVSYALYIVHLPLSYWVHEKIDLPLFGEPTGLLRDLAEFMLVAPTSLALAILSYYWIEMPFLRLKARLKGKAA